MIIDVLRRWAESRGIFECSKGTGYVLLSFVVWVLTLAHPVGLYAHTVSDIGDSSSMHAISGSYHLTYSLEVTSPAFLRFAIFSRRMPSAFGYTFDLVHGAEGEYKRANPAFLQHVRDSGH